MKSKFIAGQSRTSLGVSMGCSMYTFQVWNRQNLHATYLDCPKRSQEKDNFSLLGAWTMMDQILFRSLASSEISGWNSCLIWFQHRTEFLESHVVLPLSLEGTDHLPGVRFCSDLEPCSRETGPVSDARKRQLKLRSSCAMQWVADWLRGGEEIRAGCVTSWYLSGVGVATNSNNRQ